MKRLLLFGTLILVVSVMTQYRCFAYDGNGCCHSCSASCYGYDSCYSDPCCSGRSTFNAGFNDPYAGMYYNGCESDCIGFKKILYAPLHGLGLLFGCGGGSGCGDCMDCGETRGGCGYLYVGDYYNNPPTCDPCDGYGNLGCYQAGCPSPGNCNSCNSCDGGYSTSYGYPSTPSYNNYQYSAPQVVPAVQYSAPYAVPQQAIPAAPNPGCKNCGQGTTTHYSNNPRPMPGTVAAPRTVATRTTHGAEQQFLLQDKLIGGSGTHTYRSAPVQQATNPYQQRTYYR